MAHQSPVKVRFYELDPYNHVNHSAYVQYFEVGRIEMLESIGFGMESLQDVGRRIVVVAIQTRFVRSAGPGDQLTVETEISSIRRATVEWRQRIVRGDEEIATQVLEAAMTDGNGRPTRWLPELLDALAPHVAVRS